MSDTSVTITMADGECDADLFVPEGEGPWPAVLYYMDAPGIRPVLQDMARRLASHGYVVLLPNLFYRAGRAPLWDVATAFQDETVRNRIFSLMHALTPDVVQADTESFIEYLEDQPSVRGPYLGIVGYCMSGAMALRVAAQFPDRVVAALSFHGGNLATDAEDSPHLLAGEIDARVYVGCAAEDPALPPEMIDRLRAAFEAAGTNHQIEIYPDTKHGWTMQGFAVYQQEGAERHWDRMLALFNETLQPA